MCCLSRPLITKSSFSLLLGTTGSKNLIWPQPTRYISFVVYSTVMEVAIETVSFTTSVEGTTPAIAAVRPDLLVC